LDTVKWEYVKCNVKAIPSVNKHIYKAKIKKIIEMAKKIKTEAEYYEALWKDYEDSIKAGHVYTEVNIPKGEIERIEKLCFGEKTDNNEAVGNGLDYQIGGL
jgi:HSP90 family molecular chaperone